jgi:hypothetical protein
MVDRHGRRAIPLTVKSAAAVKSRVPLRLTVSVPLERARVEPLSGRWARGVLKHVGAPVRPGQEERLVGGLQRWVPISVQADSVLALWGEQLHRGRCALVVNQVLEQQRGRDSEVATPEERAGVVHADRVVLAAAGEAAVARPSARARHRRHRRVQATGSSDGGEARGRRRQRGLLRQRQQQRDREAEGHRAAARRGQPVF